MLFYVIITHMAAKKKIKIGVLFGGKSAEHEVSIKTSSGKKETIDECSAFSIVQITQGFVLTYVREKKSET